MRFLIAIFLIFLPIFSWAYPTEIKCYSNNGKVIYSAKTHAVFYEDGLFIFNEWDTNKTVFIQSDCIVKT